MDMFRITRLGLPLALALAAPGCTTLAGADHQHGAAPGGHRQGEGPMDMQQMCEMHRSAGPAERQAMMEERMKTMPPEMHSRMREMMERCR